MHLCTTYLDHRTKKPHYGKTDMPENGVLETVDACIVSFRLHQIERTEGQG
jgi:hypothetical protein